jgi:hypothetical protein
MEDILGAGRELKKHVDRSTAPVVVARLRLGRVPVKLCVRMGKVSQGGSATLLSAAGAGGDPSPVQAWAQQERTTGTASRAPQTRAGHSPTRVKIKRRPSKLQAVCRTGSLGLSPAGKLTRKASARKEAVCDHQTGKATTRVASLGFAQWTKNAH